MTRTGTDAILYARSRVGPDAMPASGYCLQFVRQCFDVGSYYASAIDAWNGAMNPHPGDANPPPAVPLYFLSPSIYDHVTFAGDVPGEIITTFNADVRQYTSSTWGGVIAQIERDFSAQYLGWAEDINTVRVYTPGPPPPPPFQGDTMLALARQTDDPQVWVGDGVTRRKILNEDDLRDITYKLQTGVFLGSTEVQVVDSIAWLGDPR